MDATSELSPLEEYLGRGAVSFDTGRGMTVNLTGSTGLEPSETDIARIRFHHEVVQECMRKQGFEYVVPDLTPEEIPQVARDRRELSPEEFAQEYGYAVSTTDWLFAEGPEDPNDEILAEMSESERAAYDVALRGEQSRADGYDETLGCRGEARATVEDEFPAPDVDMDWLEAELSVLHDSIQSDGRLANAEGEWASCMADAGYTGFSRIDGGRLLLSNEWDGLTGNHEGATPTPPPPDVTNDFQQREINMAVADQACRAEHYNDVFDTVVHDLEAEFVEQHKDDLEAARQALIEHRSE